MTSDYRYISKLEARPSLNPEPWISKSLRQLPVEYTYTISNTNAFLLCQTVNLCILKLISFLVAHKVVMLPGDLKVLLSTAILD